MTRRTPARTRVLLTFAGAAVALTGCGPSVRDHVGIARVATGVRYGGLSTPSPAPLVVPPASNPFSGYPPLITAPAPLPGQPVVLTTPDPCPTAGPLASVASAATPTVSGPPAAAFYTYRESGTQTETSAAGVVTRTTVGPESKVQVLNVTKDPTGAWHFRLTDSASNANASTDFVVSNGSQTPVLPTGVPSPAPANQEASTGSLQVTGVSQTDATGTHSSTFEQGNGWELLQLPGQAGSTWTSDPADPSVADGGPQSWQFSGWVGDSASPSTVTPGSDRVRVDACGTVLQGWQVTLQGTITMPHISLTVDATYVIGTQYGGIPLMSHVHKYSAKGGYNGDTFDSDITEVISQQPLPPGPS